MATIQLINKLAKVTAYLTSGVRCSGLKQSESTAHLNAK